MLKTPNQKKLNGVFVLGILCRQLCICQTCIGPQYGHSDTSEGPHISTPQAGIGNVSYITVTLHDADPAVVRVFCIIIKHMPYGYFIQECGCGRKSTACMVAVGMGDDQIIKFCDTHAFQTACDHRCLNGIAGINAHSFTVGENHQAAVAPFADRGNAIDLLPNFMLEIGILVVVTTAYLSVLDIAQSKGLETEILATLPGAVRIGKGHPKFNKPNVTATDFQDDILLDSRNASVSKALLSTGITRIKPNHNIFCSKRPVREDLINKGLAYEVTFYFPSDAENPNYRYIPMEGLSYHLVTITNPMHPPSKELDRFLEILKEEVSNTGLSVQQQTPNH